MNIRGFFKHDAPFLSAHIHSALLSLDSDIDFLIDTGASRTVLLDKDVHFLGIDVVRLQKPEKNLSGVGGSVETHIIEDAILSFLADGKFFEMDLPIFVLSHDLSKMHLEERNRILRMPSLLGRDVINNFHLHLSKDKNTVLLSPGSD